MMSVAESIPVAMTVAGSDSGGGAGIQADLRTFHALGVYGTSAIAALTSQNPHGVSRIDAVPAEGVVAQMRMVFDAFPVRAVKTGMLADAAIVSAVAAELRIRKPWLVADPVMISTSGARLIDLDAVEVLCREFLPCAAWITPNLHEAAELAGVPVDTDAEIRFAAWTIAQRFGCSVVLKGGHCNGDSASDLICHEGQFYRLDSPRLEIDPVTAHGTGCTFSAAFAAMWAKTADWRQSLLTAKAFVLGALENAQVVTDGLSQMWPPRELPMNKVTLQEVEP